MSDPAIGAAACVRSPNSGRMAALEQKLDGACFVRVHRSWLINLAHLVSIQPLEGGEALLHMADGQQVACSRRYMLALKSKLSNDRQESEPA